MANCTPDKKELTRVLRYNPKMYKAYCKYCYQNHQSWKFDGEIVCEMIDDVWVCQKCNHRTHDRHMQFDNEAPSGPQRLTYKDYTRSFGHESASVEVKEYKAWQ